MTELLTAAGGPVHTVIVHEAPKGEAGWDAYISGLPPLRITSNRELNAEIIKLRDPDPDGPPLSVDLIGVTGCITGPECPLAATATIIYTDPSIWVVSHSCDDHRPDGDRLAGPMHVVEGGIPARHASNRACIPDVYHRERGEDVAALIGLLLPYDVPPSIFPQPRCRACRKHLRPETGLELTWHAAADPPGRCKGGKAHVPASGELVDFMKRHNSDLIELLHDPDPAPEVAAS